MGIPAQSDLIGHSGPARSESDTKPVLPSEQASQVPPGEHRQHGPVSVSLTFLRQRSSIGRTFLVVEATGWLAQRLLVTLPDADRKQPEPSGHRKEPRMPIRTAIPSLVAAALVLASPAYATLQLSADISGVPGCSDCFNCRITGSATCANSQARLDLNIPTRAFSGPNAGLGRIASESVVRRQSSRRLHHAKCRVAPRKGLVSARAPSCSRPDSSAGGTSVHHHMLQT